jgi:hypothetical protein
MIEEFDPTDPSSLFDDPSDHVVNTVNRVSLSPQEAFIRTAKIFAPMGVGLILIVFGLTNTGSFYTPATIFDSGILADIFYGWQAGNLIAMVGVILIYDAIKRTGYL